MNPSDILKSVLSQKIDQAEVFISSTKSLQIDVLNQRIESIDEITDLGCGIRVIKDKKLGFAFTSDFDETVLQDTIRKAVQNSESSEPDPYHAFPEQPASQPPAGLDLFDPKIDSLPIKEKIKYALKVEETAYQFDGRVKKTEKVSYTDSLSEISIVNSNGLNVSFKSNYCGTHADVIAEHGKEMESGFGLSYVRNLDDLDPAAAGKEAAQRATELLGAKTAASQKIPIVLEPFMATRLLEVLTTPLSSEAIQKGKSLFIGRIGKQVASAVFNLIDNGRLEKGLASSPFDAEGSPTQETKLIVAGILKTFLYNSYTAGKGQTRSTGNAVRGSFKTVPIVGPTNFYVEAGKESAEAIIGSIKQGLYVTRLMGIHTANPITGDFSVGAAGIMIEKGQKTYPVRGITIAGNLIEMLNSIEAVGSDLRFIANFGSPSLLIAGITISGA